MLETGKSLSTESNDDYASLRGVTPTAPSVERFVNPRTESISRHGSPIQKDNAKERAVSPGSHPIIGEGAAVLQT